MYTIIQILKFKLKELTKLKQSNYFIASVSLLLLIVIVDVAMYFFEAPYNKHLNTFIDLIWWNVVTLSTVGYGDSYPITMEGKLIAIIFMVAGIGIMAYLLSSFVEYILTSSQKKFLGLLRIKMENHIIVCNWNDRAKDLINQLLLYDEMNYPIVLIDNALDRIPIDKISFIKGNPAEVETLVKANITKAYKVVILASGPDKSSADANTVLTSLAIRSLNCSVNICAEVLDSNNVVYLKNAKVDEIIDINTIASRFLAQTVYDPKLLSVLKTLVSKEKSSCEIYRIKIPDNLRGLVYIDLLKVLKDKYNSLIIALENSEKDSLIVNPDLNQSYDADYCFIIAYDCPNIS